MRVVKVLF